MISEGGERLDGSWQGYGNASKRRARKQLAKAGWQKLACEHLLLYLSFEFLFLLVKTMVHPCVSDFSPFQAVLI